MSTKGNAILIIAVVALAGASSVDAQRGQGAAAPPQTARAAAAIDITGTWVSVISEDWPQRMLPARKGEYTRIPLNAAARKVADTWDPARDESAGEQCKGYTAAGITRMPGRLRISWQDDDTMKMELEAGSQTRLFHFRPGQPPAEPSWQGYSAAQWMYTRQPPRSGELRVITNRLRPGYLRKNGVPYSASTVFTEYWDMQTHSNGDQYLVNTNIVDDPVYLQEPMLTALHFKKERDGSKWDPTPCDARF